MAVTINDLAAHLNLAAGPPADPVDRAEMQRMLDAALDRVRAECGTAAAGTSTVPVTSTGRSTVLLLPVVRLSAITAVLDPDGTPVTPVDVDALAGVVRVPAARSGVWRVTVTLDGLSASLELAALIVAGHLYETQRRTRPAGARPGAVAAPTGPGGLGFAIPHRAAELMAPYRLPGIA